MMSECHPKEKVIICSEIILNDYKITAKEILCHAEKLGVHFLKEPHLLPVVVRGLIHPLPVDWIPCYDTELKNFFYYNTVNGVSQWEHPVDGYYQKLITKIRNDENLYDFLNLKNNFEMLPLRQNKKPQLLPIKQLLKYKDEDKSAVADDYVSKSSLFSLKTKNDSNSNFKKSVSFASNKLKTFTENDFPLHNQSDEIPSSKNKWNDEILDSGRAGADYRELYDRSLSNSDDDCKPDKNSLQNKSQKRTMDLAVTPTALKQPINRNKILLNEKHPSKNFKRLQINLRHPDPFLFSDSNRDDTIENIVSDSVSSEIISEEETPHNILTNVTESGIDVNTVTDIQKLKAKNKMSNHNGSHNLITQGVNTSLNGAIIDLEQDLNSKFEAKIIGEVAKLKKHFSNYALNLEKQSNLEIILKETQENLQLFQREMEKKIEKSNEMIDTLKSQFDREISELKDEQKMSYDFVYGTFDERSKKLENSQQQFNDFTTKRLKDLEQSMAKKVENIGNENEKSLEKIKTEKERALFELHEKFRLFMEENEKNITKLWHGNQDNAIQNKMNELFTKEIEGDNVLSRSLEKIAVKVLSKQLIKENNIANIDQKTIATQTECTCNSEELVGMKKEIEKISVALKHLTTEMRAFKKYEENSSYRVEDTSVTFESPKRRYLRTNFNNDQKGLSNEMITSFPLKVNAYKTDFSPFEEIPSDIDKELDRYRKKYILSNSKYLLSK